MVAVSSPSPPTISIHAPSRERPISNYILICSDRNFNPRSLTGATSTPSAGTAMFSFQSTLPHGSDSIFFILTKILFVFQSTLPHGSDTKISSMALLPSRFQSTLPHGSDAAERKTINRNIIISIHAPSRERLENTR